MCVCVCMVFMCVILCVVCVMCVHGMCGVCSMCGVCRGMQRAEMLFWILEFSHSPLESQPGAESLLGMGKERGVNVCLCVHVCGVFVCVWYVCGVHSMCVCVCVCMVCMCVWYMCDCVCVACVMCVRVVVVCVWYVWCV